MKPKVFKAYWSGAWFVLTERRIEGAYPSWDCALRAALQHVRRNHLQDLEAKAGRVQ